MSKSTKSGIGRPRSIEADQAILQATLSLLAEVGYQSMSIEAIAARAGVGKATIYRRYSSKEELVADALESQFGEEEPIPDTGNFWQDLEAVIGNVIEATLTDLGRQTIALIISTASSSPQFAQIYYAKYIAPHRDALAVLFDRATQRGEIERSIDAEFFVDLVASSILYAIMFKPTLSTIESHIRRVVNLAIQGQDTAEEPRSRVEE
ncbi:TetR/AcrR family transcriptional regulator [Thermocoleostomius sinensis]|uniref:TetR/AcrR family transcriptional regulator n=1 Tax=Thermocoleostomius sinensis A174 TaxID=2016057 RepID=A0A9E8ZHE2_9CYAN|nr:TetR/AcrR family transcriptional regulator [Thermocoleostomius sinensis]WAL61859.1 TetR/AcrR family transcriptional regulator [Thermocoleostomius sinensis A174]